MSNNEIWNEYFFNIAETVKTKSKDNSTKVGAVIVGRGNEIISTGYNSFPRGINDDLQERQERPEKYFWFEHAERNSIYNAARIGVSTEGCKMYLTCGFPCTDCARAIINAGISEVYLTVGGGTKEKKKWDGHSERSMVMFEEAGISIFFRNQ